MTELPCLAYTITAAALATGRSRTRIKKAIREGEITALKDGRATIIRREELMRWLDNMPTIGRSPDTIVSDREMDHG